MAPSPSPTPTETFHTFAVSLYVYEVTKPKKTAKGKTEVSKEEKKKEIKELKISLNNSNYLPFLQSLLKKHRQDQYKLSEKKQFAFKYALPKAKM